MYVKGGSGMNPLNGPEFRSPQVKGGDNRQVQTMFLASGHPRPPRTVIYTGCLITG